MSFFHQDRPSDSPFVQTVWHTQTETDGCYMNMADGSWDIIINQLPIGIQVLLCGPASQAGPVHYRAGTESLGIRFKIGSFMPDLPTNQIVDASRTLPRPTKKTFWLHGSEWELPTFENADTFANRLGRKNLLETDSVVQSIIEGKEQKLSRRSVQRHFEQTTGLTPNYIRQIERAHLAVDLLRQGMPIVRVVYEVGYTDQPHMTKALKRLIGHTPAQILLAKP